MYLKVRILNRQGFQTHILNDYVTLPLQNIDLWISIDMGKRGSIFFNKKGSS